MLVPFCTTIKDDTLGIETIWDFKCELEVEGFEVWDVFKDGKNLYFGTALSKALAVEITDMADKELAPAYDRAASYADHRISMMKEEA